LDLFRVVPGPDVDVSVIEIVFFNVWHVAGCNLLGFEGNPVELGEPGVVLDLAEAARAQALASLSLEALVDEVSRFQAVAQGDIFLADHRLLFQNSVSDFFPAPAKVWSSAHHALVSYDANCEVVCGYPVVLFYHHFGSHVSWSAAVFHEVLWTPFSGDSEICQTQISMSVKDHVFWFDIAMDNSF